MSLILLAQHNELEPPIHYHDMMHSEGRGTYN